MVALAVVFLVAARRYVAIQGLLLAVLLARGPPSPVAAGPGRAVGFLSLVMLAACIPYLGVGWPRRQGLVAHAVPPAVHLAVLRAGDRGDAEVHRQQPALLDAGGGRLRRGGRAHCLVLARTAPARARHARRPQHADPGPAGHRDRHRLHPGLPLPPAVARPQAHQSLDRAAAGCCDPALAVHVARRLRLAAARAPLDGGGGGQRRRHRAAQLPRRDAAAHLAWRAGRLAVLVRDLAAGGLAVLSSRWAAGRRSRSGSSRSTSPGAPTRRPRWA